MRQLKSFLTVAVLLAAVALWPARALAQVPSTIAGVVKDTSGAVMPGVTVEASSPALIEKVRSAVTDGEGLYKIIDLVPGTYSVTFTLSGFSPFKRDGIEMTSGFTASVNAELRAGAVSETITVSGQSPLIDVQNTTASNTLSHDMLEQLPANDRIASFATLTPGIAASNDVGGNQGELGTLAIHGGSANDQRLLQDGMRFNSMEGSGRGFYINPAMTQEVNLALGGNPVDQEFGGIQINVIPREGGNTFHGYVFGNYSGESLQSDNLSNALKNRGLTTPATVDKIYDVNGSFGGPIKKDALWFYAAERWFGYANLVPGGFYNATQGTNFYTPNTSLPSQQDEDNHNHSIRFTWQASPHNKFNFSWDIENNCDCHQSITSATSPEAAIRWYFANPNYLTQASWTHPTSSKLLLQAGVTTLIFNFPTVPQAGVSPNDISIGDTTLAIRYNSLAIQTYEYGFKHSSQSNQMFSASYVTGSHALKVGVFTMEGWRDQQNYVNQNLNYTFLNRIPSQISEAIPYEAVERLKMDLGVYASDVWTIKRLTVSPGLRFDYLNAFDPPQGLAASQFTPAANFAQVNCVPCWNDISPRLGVAYDLFGDGKTAVKASIGKYVTAESVNDLAFSNDPITTSVTSASRTWGDSNGNYIPDCNLSNPAAQNLTAAGGDNCGAVSNNNFGKANPSATVYSPSVLNGNRNYNWQLTASMQHQLSSGVSVNVGYFRTWYGNFMTTQNLANTPANYSPYCATAPADARLPNGGNYQVCGLYDVAPNLFGLTQNLVTEVANAAVPFTGANTNETSIYNGIDVTFKARVKGGVFLNGGLNTGHTVTNTCFVVNSPQSLLNCNAPLPFWYPQWKFSGAYSLPLAFQISATYQDYPGIAISASDTFTNSQVSGSLGRNLSSGVNGTVAVPLIVPNTQFEGRNREVDLRLTRTFKFSSRRNVQAIVDLYNAFNANPILGDVTTYGPRWLTPTAILAGRLLKFGLQANF